MQKQEITQEFLEFCLKAFIISNDMLKGSKITFMSTTVNGEQKVFWCGNWTTEIIKKLESIELTIAKTKLLAMSDIDCSFESSDNLGGAIRVNNYGTLSCNGLSNYIDQEFCLFVAQMGNMIDASTVKKIKDKTEKYRDNWIN